VRVLGRSEPVSSAGAPPSQHGSQVCARLERSVCMYVCVCVCEEMFAIITHMHATPLTHYTLPATQRTHTHTHTHYTTHTHTLHTTPLTHTHYTLHTAQCLHTLSIDEARNHHVERGSRECTRVLRLSGVRVRVYVRHVHDVHACA
jgi:hypothetical protein